VLILNTGLRVGEASAIKLSDIDFYERTLKIERSLFYNPQKGALENGTKFRFQNPKYNSKRIIPLNDTAYEAVVNQMKVRNSPYKNLPEEFKDLLFLNRRGRPLDQRSINHNISVIVNRININNPDIEFKRFGIHVLRHTFATNCIDLGMEPNKLKTILGHANITVTLNNYVKQIITKYDTAILDELYETFFAEEPDYPVACS